MNLSIHQQTVLIFVKMLQNAAEIVFVLLYLRMCVRNTKMFIQSIDSSIVTHSNFQWCLTFTLNVWKIMGMFYFPLVFWCSGLLCKMRKYSESLKFHNRHVLGFLNSQQKQMPSICCWVNYIRHEASHISGFMLSRSGVRRDQWTWLCRQPFWSRSCCCRFSVWNASRSVWRVPCQM